MSQTERQMPHDFTDMRRQSIRPRRAESRVAVAGRRGGALAEAHTAGWKRATLAPAAQRGAGLGADLRPHAHTGTVPGRGSPTTVVLPLVRDRGRHTAQLKPAP